MGFVEPVKNFPSFLEARLSNNVNAGLGLFTKKDLSDGFELGVVRYTLMRKQFFGEPFYRERDGAVKHFPSNIGVFVNHSCEPNFETYKFDEEYFDVGDGGLALFWEVRARALKRVSAGSEIVWSYSLYDPEV